MSKGDGDFAKVYVWVAVRVPLNGEAPEIYEFRTETGARRRLLRLIMHELRGEDVKLILAPGDGGRAREILREKGYEAKGVYDCTAYTYPEYVKKNRWGLMFVAWAERGCRLKGGDCALRLTCPHYDTLICPLCEGEG